MTEETDTKLTLDSVGGKMYHALSNRILEALRKTGDREAESRFLDWLGAHDCEKCLETDRSGYSVL